MKFSCAFCNVAMKVEKIGVTLLETAGREQQPYLFSNADLLECPICSYQMVFTDARPSLHAHSMSVTEINKKILSASNTSRLFLSHEYPAGGYFFQRLLTLKGEK